MSNSNDTASPAVLDDRRGERAKPSDFIVPAVIFAFCGIVAYLCTTFEEAPEAIVGHAMQPRNFPMFLAAVIAVLNLLLIWQLVENPPKFRSPIIRQTWVTLALVPLFYIVTTYIDMFLAIAIALFVMCVVWGERRLWVAGLVAVLTPTFIFFFFDLVLSIQFPRGLLTSLYYD